MLVVATISVLALLADGPEKIVWARDWNEAAERSRAERKPILVHAFFQGPIAWSEESAGDDFSLPEVVALVNERYVPLKLGPGVTVPFADPKLYGMGSYTFGSALLVVDPDGRVLRDRYGPAWEVLVEGLSADPELDGPPVAQSSDPLDHARALLRHGDLDLALDVATPIQTAAAQHLVARMHALRRNGEKALAALAEAKRLPGCEAIASDLHYDEVLFQLKAGHPRESRALALDFVKTRPDDPRRAGLEKYMKDLDALPLPPESLRWSRPSVVESLRPISSAPLPPAAAARAAADGADWLVRTQQAQGHWDGPTQYGADLDPALDPLAVATAALAMRALTTQLRRPGAEAAIERSSRWLEHVAGQRRATPFQKGPLDYTAWAWAALVGSLARASEGDPRRRERLAPTLATAIDELVKCRDADGGWSYLTTEGLLAAPKQCASMSFTTAFALHALLDARDAALEVPECALEGAIARLEQLRGEDGAFGYLAAGDPLRDGAALRGPQCAHALLRAGEREGDLDGALERFRLFLPRLSHERGHTLMHCGPQGEGSHWILFDLWTAAAAARELPADERPPWRSLLLPEILATRRIDGSFCDMPLLGPACGTAQALLALDALHSAER
jgi:hypothetical protein